MDATETAKNVMKSLTQLKESTTVVLIGIITLIIILIALLYYFYYSRLRSKNCSSMDSLYGDLNGKIKSLALT